MTIEENKALVRRFYEDAPQNPSACDEIFAPVIRWVPIQHTSLSNAVESTPAEEKGSYQGIRATWPDWDNHIDEMIAEGDRVMVRWTFSGTQEGDYYGLPGTRRKVSYSGINIFHIRDGKIYEVWDIYDRLWLWQQLGVLPETRAFIEQAKYENRSTPIG
jgi:steroid delta-isomerase-like uncharacterized protein